VMAEEKMRTEEWMILRGWGQCFDADGDRKEIDL